MITQAHSMHMRHRFRKPPVTALRLYAQNHERLAAAQSTPWTEAQALQPMYNLIAVLWGRQWKMKLACMASS